MVFPWNVCCNYGHFDCRYALLRMCDLSKRSLESHPNPTDNDEMWHQCSNSNCSADPLSYPNYWCVWGFQFDCQPDYIHTVFNSLSADLCGCISNDNGKIHFENNVYQNLYIIFNLAIRIVLYYAAVCAVPSRCLFSMLYLLPSWITHQSWGNCKLHINDMVPIQDNIQPRA